jgi:hypothetical protein
LWPRTATKTEACSRGRRAHQDRRREPLHCHNARQLAGQHFPRNVDRGNKPDPLDDDRKVRANLRKLQARPLEARSPGISPVGSYGTLYHYLLLASESARHPLMLSAASVPVGNSISRSSRPTVRPFPCATCTQPAKATFTREQPITMTATEFNQFLPVSRSFSGRLRGVPAASPVARWCPATTTGPDGYIGFSAKGRCRSAGAGRTRSSVR